MTYAADDIANELRRELTLRRRNYPRWVSEGRMSQSAADRQIKILEQAIDDYARRNPQSDFFASRMAASAVAAELLGILDTDPSADQRARFTDRLEKAMREGK